MGWALSWSRGRLGAAEHRRQPPQSHRRTQAPPAPRGRVVGRGGPGGTVPGPCCPGPEGRASQDSLDPRSTSWEPRAPQIRCRAMGAHPWAGPGRHPPVLTWTVPPHPGHPVLRGSHSDGGALAGHKPVLAGVVLHLAVTPLSRPGSARPPPPGTSTEPAPLPWPCGPGGCTSPGKVQGAPRAEGPGAPGPYWPPLAPTRPHPLCSLHPGCGVGGLQWLQPHPRGALGDP